jgi:hypothetical protein
VRLGAAGDLERNPYTGWYALEVPTLSAGYQFHGDGTHLWVDSMHFEIGPRSTFGVVGRAFAADGRADFVAAPALGGRAILMGEGVSFQTTTMHYFESDGLDLAEALACYEGVIAVCFDARLVRALYVPESGGSPAWGLASSIGFSFGLGWATGTSM